jgi:hypothetical protein
MTVLTEPPTDDDFLRRRRTLLLAQLDDLAREIQMVPGFDSFGAAPDIADVYRAAASTDLLYVAVADGGAMAFVVDGRRREVVTRQLPDLDASELTRRSSAYLAAPEAFRLDPGDATARARWLAELNDVRQWLWAVLLEPVLDSAAEHRALTLVLPGRLALLPDIAAKSVSDRSDTDYPDEILGRVALRQASSATALLAAQVAAARPMTPSALVVADPSADGAGHLVWAAAKAHALDRHLARVHILRGPEATLDALRSAMPNHGILHFACHGSAFPDRPLDSYLELARDDVLTVRMLSSGGQLWGTRICVLSACDTATIGAIAPSEVVAMPSALIRLGVGAVLATQWPVADAVAAVFTLRFYEVWLGDGREAGIAFADTQRWLRTASRRDVASLLRRVSLPPAEAAQLVAAIPAIAVPFARVEDWAAFTFTGH